MSQLSVSSRESFFENDVRAPVTEEELKDFQKTKREEFARLASKKIEPGNIIEEVRTSDAFRPAIISQRSGYLSSSAATTASSISTDSISSTLSKEEIRNKKTLFSSADFKTLVGPARWWHGAAYRTVIHALRDYERDEGSLTNEQKTSRLEDLEKKATIYLNKKQAELNKKSNSECLKDRVNAAQFLINGIHKELEKVATETFQQAKETFQTDDIVNLQKTKECTLLSGGNVNERVEKITLEDGSATVFKAVHKTATFDSETAALAGIPNTSTTHLASRSVGAYFIDKLLGWDLVPKTAFATYKGNIGFCQDFVQGESLFKEGFVPIASKKVQDTTDKFYDCFDTFFAKGDKALGNAFNISCKPPLTKREDGIYKNGRRIELKEALQLLEKGEITFSKKQITHLSALDLSSPPLQKALSKAHLFYLAVGAVDPNLSNFLLTEKNVRLVDNDFSFPEEFQRFNNPPDSSLEIIRRRTGMPVDVLPRLIDREAAEEIESLDLDKVSQGLKEPHWTDQEIEATKNRITLLKEYIAQARKNGASGVPRLIDTWNKETFEELTTPREEDNTCRYDNYVGVMVESQKELREKLEREALQYPLIF